MSVIKEIKKHLPETFFIVSVLTLLVILLIGITSSKSYQFLSKAEDDRKPIEFTSISTEPILVEENELPGCVSSLQYLPPEFGKSNDGSCFVQFECVKDVMMGDFSNFCSRSEGLVTCDKEDCMTIDEWIGLSESVCGCGGS